MEIHLLIAVAFVIQGSLKIQMELVLFVIQLQPTLLFVMEEEQLILVVQRALANFHIQVQIAINA